MRITIKTLQQAQFPLEISPEETVTLHINNDSFFIYLF